MICQNLVDRSGHTWETLSGINPAWFSTQRALDYIDVLVDGPFVRELDDPYIAYRGSRNQRSIDVQATRRTGEIVTLDWSNPEIVLTGNGDLFMPVGLAAEMAEIGGTIIDCA